MATEKKYVSLSKLGIYDEKIKKVISDSDAATLASAQEFATNLGSNYDEAGAAATAEANAKAYADGKDTAIAAAKKAGDDAAAAAAIADGKAVAAQGEVDALEAYVGTFTASEGVDTVVKYIDAKTANIASDETVSALDDRVTQAEKDIDAIEADYLKAADKTELAGDIADVQAAVDAEADRADKAEKANAAAIKAIADDYLKAADKAELQGEIEVVEGAIERLTNGVSTEEIDGVNDLIQYVKDHGAEVTGMQSDIAQNASDIAGVAGRMTIAEGEIEALDGEVATKAEKTYVDEADKALGDKIAALEGKFTEGEGSVSDMISDAIDVEAARVNGELAKKVDKVDGKGLSTNDLTNELKGQYDAAYAHSQAAHAPVDAQANIIETVKVNGSALTVTGKAVDISVPTNNNQLENGAGYLVAGDIANKADKGTTLASYGITDAYTSVQTDSAIATAIGQFVECSEAEINALFGE